MKWNRHLILHTCFCSDSHPCRSSRPRCNISSHIDQDPLNPDRDMSVHLTIKARPCIGIFISSLRLSVASGPSRQTFQSADGRALPCSPACPALASPDSSASQSELSFSSPLLPHLRRTPYHTSVHHPRSLPRHFVRSFLSPRGCAHDTLKGATPFSTPVLTAQGYLTNMAAAQLAIAKASLLASLLKADADADLASCSRDEIEQFHGLLNAAVAKCSPTNVQVWNTHATPF